MIKGKEDANLFDRVMTSSDKQMTWPAERVILSLLDDESPPVRDAMVKLFEVFPAEGRTLLKKIGHQANGIHAKHAKELQVKLGWTDGKEDFLDFIRSRRYELETGWSLLDRTVNPAADSVQSSLQLDQLADRVRELIANPIDSRQICIVINRVLFHECGYRGARQNFEEPENSFLHLVLEKKRGLPITLSLIYLLVARRVGFELEPIGLPGRFMVGCFAGDIPFYIDVWAGGKIIDLEDMGSYLGISMEESSGSILLPVTVSEMLTRGCRNLVHHYRLKGKKEEAEMFSSFIAEFEKIRSLETNA